MNLQNMMRMGSLAMNLLQSDHLKELMGLMGNMNSPYRMPWFSNQNVQEKTAKKPQQPSLKQPGGQENNFQFEHPMFPFQSMFGNQQNQTFPFSSNNLPSWMMQRPRTGKLPQNKKGQGIPFFEQMWRSAHPSQSSPSFDPFSMGGYTTSNARTHKSQQNRITIQDLHAKKKNRKRNAQKTMAKKH